MKAYKTVFFEDDEMYKVLPHEVYHDVVNNAGSLITKENIFELMEDIKNFPENYGYDAEDLVEELQNAFGSSYDELMNDEIDLIQVTKDN